MVDQKHWCWAWMSAVETLSLSDLLKRTVSPRQALGNTLEKAHQGISISRQQPGVVEDLRPSLMRQIRSKETSDKVNGPSTQNPPGTCRLRAFIHQMPPRPSDLAPSPTSLSCGLRLGWEILGHFPNLELEEISPTAATHMAPPMTDNRAPEESNVVEFF